MSAAWIGSVCATAAAFDATLAAAILGESSSRSAASIRDGGSTARHFHFGASRFLFWLGTEYCT